MELYLIIAALLFFVAYLDAGVGSRRLARFCFLLVFVFSAFRFRVGPDWYGYLNQWMIVRDISDVASKGSEVAWWAMIWLLKSAGFPYPSINVLSSAIFFAGLYHLAMRNPRPTLVLAYAFPVLVINMPMSGIRQAVAIGLMCFASTAAYERRVSRFVWVTSLAALFHVSAAAFLLIVPLLGRGRLSLGVLSFSVLGVLAAFGLTSGSVLDEYSVRYVESGVDGAGSIYRVAILALAAPYYFLAVRPVMLDRVTGLIARLDFLGVALLLPLFLLPISALVADRFAYYLYPLQCGLLAGLSTLRVRDSRWFYVLVPVFGLMLLLLVWVLNSEIFSLGYLPYRSWILGFPDGPNS